MAAEASKPEEHRRYEITKVIVHATDPYSKERVAIKFDGKGTCLVEPVLRKTEESPKTPRFDGNQMRVVLSIDNKEITPL